MQNLLRALAVRVLAVVGVLVFSAGCTVHQTEVPALAGPSEFGSTFRITATPDQLIQDGASQATILVTAFDSTGRPTKGVSFLVYSDQDYGTLSSNRIITSADGKATAIYTAPLAQADSGAAGIEFAAEPVGSNYGTTRRETAMVLLLPPRF